jgi:hypothetical protein
MSFLIEVIRGGAVAERHHRVLVAGIYQNYTVRRLKIWHLIFGRQPSLNLSLHNIMIIDFNRA